MKDLPAHLERSIRERGLVGRGQALLVAVSGGADSIALLHLLHRLGRRRGSRLTVAHFNHQWRGAASDADADFVRAAAENLGLPFVMERAAGSSAKIPQGSGPEMGARILRHDFLGRAARRESATTVALAHHADDQAELFFLRLLRGAGSRGLGGMGWRGPNFLHPKVEIIRPLLDVSKSDLLAWLAAEGIAFRVDASNDSTDFLRNRIRHKLLPVIAREFGTGSSETILRAMEILGGEGECLEEIATSWLGHARRVLFARLPVALQRHTLRLQLERAGIPADFDLIEKLRLLPNRKVSVSAHGSVLRDCAGKLSSHTPRPAAFNGNSISLHLSGTRGVQMFDGVKIDWQLRRVARGFRLPASQAGREFFRVREIASPVLLRHWRAGDRFQPIGLGRAVKLQDLFTNLKIAHARRRELVVAETAAGELFWVEGLRIAEKFKVKPSATRLLEWCWERV